MPFKEVNRTKILEMYNDGQSIKNISKYFNLSAGPITRVLKSEGINLKLRIGSNSRFRKVDETFFDIIDTPEKAYILGWIISDGYVNKYKLSFYLKDIEILEMIKRILKSEHKISSKSIYDKRTEKTYKQTSLQINSQKISQSLSRLGINQAKSYNVDLPKIRNKLHSHLLRGIFDGDGYIGIGQKKKGIFPRFSLIVSENLYNSLEPIFNKRKIYFKKPSVVSERNGDRILKIFVYKKEELGKFFKFIYKDSDSLRLSRKYDKYIELYEIH